MEGEVVVSFDAACTLYCSGVWAGCTSLVYAVYFAMRTAADNIRQSLIDAAVVSRTFCLSQATTDDEEEQCQTDYQNAVDIANDAHDNMDQDAEDFKDDGLAFCAGVWSICMVGCTSNNSATPAMEAAQCKL